MAIFYNNADFKKRRVHFTGSTALRKGTGVCYEADYYSSTSGEAVTDPCQLRQYRVEVPTTSNNMYFAGVTVKAYSAVSGGQEIEIYEPGGCAYILIDQDTGVPSGSTSGTQLTCTTGPANPGWFSFSGHSGRGSALALETDASGQLFQLVDGSAATAYAGGVSTITATGIGTASDAGDRLIVYGGSTQADASEQITEGIYTIVSTPTADTITIATDIGDGDCDVAVVPAADHVVLAYLQDGMESGLSQWLSADSVTAAQQSMIGGLTIFSGGVTLGTADNTATLADGTIEGMLKSYYLTGALTTNDYLVTVTSGLQQDGTTTLASLEFDGAADTSTLQWRGNLGPGTNGAWCLVFNVGAAKA